MKAHTTPELDSGFFDGEFSVKKVLELLGDPGNDMILVVERGLGAPVGSCYIEPANGRARTY